MLILCITTNHAIEIHSKTDFASKKISHLGVYAMYLRNGEIFKIHDGGNLKPLLIDDTLSTKVSREGRYFVGAQIKGNEACSILINTAEQLVII